MSSPAATNYTSMPDPIKVAIIKDQRTIREGLATLIDGTEGFRRTGSYVSMEEALKMIGPNAGEGEPSVSRIDPTRIKQDVESIRRRLTIRIMRILCIHRCRRAHYLWMSAAVGMALAAALACRVPRNGAATTPVTTQSRAGTVAPAGADVLAGIEWVRVAAPGGELSAAVARPPGKGPFPVIVILHGTHGFAREYVRLAHDIARTSGVVAVAGCWFAGGQGEGRQFVTSIECQGAPAMPRAASDAALDSVGALVAAAKDLPGVRRDSVALFGHSRGGGAALHYVCKRGGVRTAVLNSTGYPQFVVESAGEVSAPLLLLHGTEDGNPADGGSDLSKVDRARAFEDALRKAGKPVEAVYFDGGRHHGLFTNVAQYDDTVRRVAAFLRRRLAE